MNYSGNPSGPRYVQFNSEIYTTNPCRAASYLEKECIVISCGIQEFETGSFSEFACCDVKRYLDNVHRGKYRNGLLREGMFRDIFLRSFK